MKRKNQKGTQGEFYAWFKKNHPEIVKGMKEWDTKKWSPTKSGFDGYYDSGWNDFLSCLPDKERNNIEDYLFEFDTNLFNTEKYFSDLKEIVERYWNKIVITKNLFDDEENRFRDLLNGIKTISTLMKYGTIRVSEQRYGERLEGIRVENFKYKELPPNIPEVSDRTFQNNYVYQTKTGMCWWEIKNIGFNTGYLYFNSNEPQYVPEMKCTIQDGVFMAIPSNLVDKALSARFNKLLTDDRTRPLPPGKKRMSENLIRRKMREKDDWNFLDNIVRDYDLQIDDMEYDNDNSNERYTEDVIKTMRDYGYLTKERG